jgi:CheY-like chemotaxis protein
MTKILFADSDPHILQLCQEELVDEGYEVMLASNGQEAVQLMQSDCPDLVVLELLLPDMSGVETMQIIRGTCKETPVIFHSTYNISQPFKPDGSYSMVLKSYDLDHLKGAVRGALKTCRRNRANRLNGYN